MSFESISSHLFRWNDTCAVYVLKTGTRALLIDFGSGDVLDHLPEIGVEEVSAILMTHHHRDQAQGLPRAIENQIPVYVPHTEQDLFAQVERHWQGREIRNNYNVRQDRFSLLSSIPIAGTLQDYQTFHWQSYSFYILPTPGHTTGSISLIAEIDSQRIAFTGDLIYAPGKVWSLSATQWTYNGVEGIAAGIVSLLTLKDQSPALLLPSHGEPMYSPVSAIDLLIERQTALLRQHGKNPRLFDLYQRPYERVTPHLLKHRASLANAYVLLSDSGKVLIFDFGYDFVTGVPAGFDRASRRPNLVTIAALKRDFGIHSIEVVLPTHYHDDHVAGMNLLRNTESTQTWVPENFAHILANPENYDLPCLWYDPIPADRILPLNQPIQWQEYTLSLVPLPGHTSYAVGIFLEVDGCRVFVTGDQYQGDDGTQWNYVYQNRYVIGDYLASAYTYAQIKPDLVLSGHWNPLWTSPDYAERLIAKAQEMEDLQRSLLPQSPKLGAEGFLARLTPYHISLPPGNGYVLTAEIRNPFTKPAEAQLQLVLPPGCAAEGAACSVTLHQKQTVLYWQIHISADAQPDSRMRLGLDVTINGQRFGQQAEALVTVLVSED